MTAHETYMRTALEAARKLPGWERSRWGPVLSGTGRSSRWGTIPGNRSGHPLGHAEINAIRQACQRLGAGGWTAVCCM